MMAGVCETAAAEMVDRCEGPRLPSETVPQQDPSSSNSPKSSSRSRSRRTIVLNVGGERHEITRKNLRRMPRTRLGRLVELLGDSDVDPSLPESNCDILDLCDDVSRVEVGGGTRTEYYFDRHPRSFTAVIEFYRTGKLHIIDDVCALSFSDDLDYWMTGERG